MNAIAAIDKLKELPADWDSYGADPIALNAQESAKRFLTRIATALGPAYTEPAVGPTPDGGVALLWRRPKGLKVEASFFPSGGGQYTVIQQGKLLAREPVDGPDAIRILQRYLTA